MPDAREWLVRRGREVRGPFNSDQLREFARAGKIRPDDHLAQGRDGPWHEAASICGLFVATADSQAAVAATPPPSPPLIPPHAQAALPAIVLHEAPSMPCPSCGRYVQLPMALMGQAVACPFCGSQFAAAVAQPTRALVSIPGPVAPAPSQQRRFKSSRRTKTPSLAYIGICAVLLIGITVAATLWATGSLSKARGGHALDASKVSTVATEPSDAAPPRTARPQPAEPAANASVKAASAPSTQAETELPATDRQAAKSNEGSDPADAGPRTGQSTEEQTVESLRRGIARFRALVDDSKFVIIDERFDVQKSASLVSPFIATITYMHCSNKSLRDNKYAWYEHQDTLGWQNGRWVVTQRLMRNLPFDGPLKDAKHKDFLLVDSNVNSPTFGTPVGGYSGDQLFELQDRAFSTE